MKILPYLSHVLLFCFSLLDRPICCEYDAYYFCGHHISLVHARFQLYGSWATITTELLLKEEFE